MKEFTIQKNDEAQRLDKFLQKAVPALPQSLLYKSIRQKRIKVNGKRGAISYRLQEGDKVELYLNDEFFSANPKQEFLLAPAKLDILYEDENVLFVVKKPGLCVHEDDAHSVDTLIHRILHYLYDKGEYDPAQEISFTPALCNRIDRNTGGIVIAAKNAEALRILNEKIKQREVHKYYLCVISGFLSPKTATLKAYLLKDENNSTVKVFDTPHDGAKTILTRYHVLKESDANSLLEIELLTGRTHQIRAHLAHIGHPLLGDGKYGKNALNRKYNVKNQLLYAYKLRFDFSDSGHSLDYLNGREFKVDDVWFADRFAEEF